MTARKLSEAKAEIYHLTTERDEWHLRCEKAEAEIARLRKTVEYHAAWKGSLGEQARAALKPDTGENRDPIREYLDKHMPDIEAYIEKGMRQSNVIKPDTGE